MNNRTCTGCRVVASDFNADCMVTSVVDEGERVTSDGRATFDVTSVGAVVVCKVTVALPGSEPARVTSVVLVAVGTVEAFILDVEGGGPVSGINAVIELD